MASTCEGRHVALYDADVAAPAELSLAGVPLTASARVRTKCIPGALSTTRLLREDGLASTRGDGPPPTEAALCGRCADAYDARRDDLGCSICAARLSTTDLISPYLAADGVLRCAQCALDTAVQWWLSSATVEDE